MFAEVRNQVRSRMNSQLTCIETKVLLNTQRSPPDGMVHASYRLNGIVV